MIKDQEFLYGAAFVKLINFRDQITITHASGIHNSLYLVETDSTKSAVLFKLSTQPKSPWPFSFSDGEESALDRLKHDYSRVPQFLALVCHKDGICCLAIDDQGLWSILDKKAPLSVQRISVARKPRGSYHVSGPGKQQMEQTIPQINWPRIVL
ncbi:hypothetical protein NG799_15035 [Laspinema sp. D1]|uniref:Uncharacterized protein n=1 Tax=Laspinema palackyanum D2a TaxID=2953684 RepID=A0ABT2MSD2_9CYAN|nr:hypothetical protein [Laspinema sp. D2a]